MYEELVTALRKRAAELPEKFSKNAENIDLFLKAVDAIKELQERVAASEVTIKRQSDIIQAKDRDLQRAIDAKPQWISVADRLPKDMECVLCETDAHEMFIAACYIYGDGNEFDFDDDNGMMWDGKVTHWMLLPEEPMEETCTKN